MTKLGLVLGGLLSLTLLTVQVGNTQEEGLKLRHESMTTHVKSQRVIVVLHFSDVPDLTNGDGFQHYLFWDQNPDMATHNGNVIIQGGSIGKDGLIPIRLGFPPSDDPEAGGWGELLTRVPFNQVGKTVTFNFSLAEVQAPVQSFAYSLEVHQQGILTDHHLNYTKLLKGRPLAFVKNEITSTP